MAAIEVRGLTKRYGQIAALDDVDLTVGEGEIFGVVGPNGAGKTTLVECIEGIRVPDQGEVRVLGRDPWRDRTEVRRLLGAQLQDSRLPDKLRAREAVDLYRSFYSDAEDPDRLLSALGLAGKADTYFEDLSGGQQQRLSVALALVGRPRVAVLDELTTGLDPQARRETWQLVREIRQGGVTIVLVTHFMDEAEQLCDRLAVIDRGRVVALDTPAGLVRHASDEVRVRFRPSSPVDEAELLAIAAVDDVGERNGEVVVRGRGDLLPELMRRLDDAGVTATEIRVEQPTLDDAFVALTGPAPAQGTGGR